MNSVESYYAQYDEDARFRSKSRQTEYLTTIRYIQKYLSPGAKILEIGAGTGQYSLALAEQGFVVDAVDILPKHIAIMQKKATHRHNLRIYQGNAVNLRFLADNTYDLVLLLGPMYHLFTDAEQQQALREAIRTAKPNGIIFAAYCNNDTTVYNSFAGRQIQTYSENGFLSADFQFKPDPKAVFAFRRKQDIDRLMQNLPAERLHFVGTDMLSYFFSDAIDNFSDAEFRLYMQYHFQICERKDCIGMSFHFLDIFRKRCPCETDAK